MSGRELMEKALQMRTARGLSAAIAFLVKHGIAEQMAKYALMGNRGYLSRK